MSAGGSGLLGSYYNDNDGAVDAFIGSQIDPIVTFSSSSGYIIPTTLLNNKGIDDKLLLRNNGQFVRWEGYIVSPTTDVYEITARFTNMNAVIYIDDELIYNNNPDVMIKVSLQENSAYKIRVEGSIDKSMQNKPVSVALLWQARLINLAIIPQFYLYDSADEVYLSPFSIKML
jgi:hypothetical protein